MDLKLILSEKNKYKFVKAQLEIGLNVHVKNS